MRTAAMRADMVMLHVGAVPRDKCSIGYLKHKVNDTERIEFDCMHRAWIRNDGCGDVRIYGLNSKKSLKNGHF
jgi:hypothetical protein